MTDATKILDFAGKELASFLRDLKTAVELESPTYGNREASDKCCSFFREFYTGLGCNVTTIPQTECGDHIVAEYGEGDTTLLVVGHYDTVYPIGSLATMPWRQEGGKVYGPGVLDMKGGLLQAGYALKILQKLNIPLNKKIRIVVSADEEAGSKTSAGMYKKEAERSNWAVVLEPGQVGIGGIKTARRGRSVYKVVAHGRASHAGNQPREGVNVALELAGQLPKLHKMNNFDENITVTPTFATAGNDDTAMVPDLGHITLDVRAPDIEALMGIDRNIRALTPELEGAHLEILGGIEKPPLQFTETNQKFFAIADALARELGVSLVQHTVGGGSDGNFTASTGLPTLDGMGMTGEFVHNPKEYIAIDHIPFRIALLARLMQTL